MPERRIETPQKKPEAAPKVKEIKAGKPEPIPAPKKEPISQAIEKLPVPREIEKQPETQPPEKAQTPEVAQRPKMVERPPEPPPEVKQGEPEPPAAEKEPEIHPPKQDEKPKERVKLGLVSAVKSIITRQVRIEENDVKEMLDDFEIELLEADVDITVAGSIKESLREKLVGAKIGKDELHAFVSRTIKETLVDILTNEKKFTIPDRMDKSEKPLKIMFLGINGAGKTTTIAKVASMLLAGKRKVVFAAADTFRAAAIEQMAVHADRLGVRIIKRDYGSDPTSVAYDAVNYAKAHAVDAVLIDTAGRQDTNVSLMNEMKKMNRVIAPDIKVYIGESIAGNAIIEQINAFNREIGLDAVILTKLDCDPKGGTMLSINRATGIPIIYVGVGQGYDDLEPFDPQKIVDRIVE